jgi:hypothetical protein
MKRLRYYKKYDLLDRIYSSKKHPKKLILSFSFISLMIITQLIFIGLVFK